MTYQESQQRDEAYRAGREGRSVYTAYGDDYDRGKKERARAKARRESFSEGSGSGAAYGILMLVALALLAAFVVAAIGAAVGAFVAALPLWLLARLPPGGWNIDYASSYRASFAALLTWVIVTLVVGVGAESLRTDAPGAWHEWVRGTAQAFEHGAAYLTSAASSFVSWPDQNAYAQSNSIGAGLLEIVSTQPAPRERVWTPEVFAVLILLPMLGAAIALRATLPFTGWNGLARAVVAAPLVVAPGVAPIVVLLVGLAWLAVHAETPPMPDGWGIGSVAVLTLAVLGAAAVAGSLLGGLCVAVVTAAVTLGRRFLLGAASTGAGFGVLVAGLTTALALYLFRYADVYAAHVAAGVAAGAVTYPPWSALMPFIVVAAPGVLLGASVLRAAMRDLKGLLGYLGACALFAPIALVFATAALAMGFLALDSPQIQAWLRF